MREIRPHAALTPAGRVRRALGRARDRGLHGGLRGLRRALVPMNSSMIVTEPLSAAGVGGDRLGAAARRSSDAAHVYVYLQRTADGRIAIGGRGVPYRYGSRTDRSGETPRRDGREPAREARWRCSRRRRTRRSTTRGRACSACRATGASRSTPTRRRGHRVGRRLRRRGRRRGEPRRAHAARPAARRAHRADTRCRGSGAPPRRWEPEPLRWAAIHAVYSLYRRADRGERAQRAALAARRASSTTSRVATEREHRATSPPRRGTFRDTDDHTSAHRRSEEARCPTRRCSTTPPTRSRRSR